MSHAYRVFTVESGVSAGAKIETLRLKGAGIEIPAILVGEEGRGRRQEAIPVDTSLMAEGVLMYAEVGQTKAGKPKFFAKDAPTTDEKVVVVLRTKIGFRGGNDHTGDRKQEWYTLQFPEVAEAAGVPIQERYTPEGVKGYSPRIIAAKYPEPGHTFKYNWDAGFEVHRDFKPFPGQKLVSGTIAQGTAGGMGSGEQLVAVIPKGVVFRTAYSGRLYGKPSAHYYLWNGEKLLCATWEEREASDLF